jgi:hypothetical protein
MPRLHREGKVKLFICGRQRGEEFLDAHWEKIRKQSSTNIEEKFA